jgi:hypothetical protein
MDRSSHHFPAVTCDYRVPGSGHPRMNWRELAIARGAGSGVPMLIANVKRAKEHPAKVGEIRLARVIALTESARLPSKIDVNASHEEFSWHHAGNHIR